MSVEIVIGLVPVPASRPRVARSGAVYYPKTHAAYRRALNDFFSGDVPCFRLHEEAKYHVEAEFVFPPMKTSKHPIPRADVDNLWKLPIDAMTDAAKYWHDDHQIVETTISKRFAEPNEPPHTRIILKEA